MNISHVIVSGLIEQGIDTFFIAPGSRSTPLTYAIAHHPQAKSTVHFDERGLGFLALGYAKATRKPGVIVVTSGTAVGNLYPAVMEAAYSQTPLLLLTADRPTELRDTGANQTCNQVKIFGHFVQWDFDLPCSDLRVTPQFIGTTLSQALYRSRKGPVHINCMLREPFDLSLPAVQVPMTAYEASEPTPSSSSINTWAEKLEKIEKGVILIGENSSSYSRKGVFQLAEKLQWPIFAEITSQSRGERTLAYYDLILKTHPELKPEAILHLGDRLVSKTLVQLNAPLYCLVANHPLRHDPLHHVTHRIESDPFLFCEQVAQKVAPKQGWLSLFEHYEQDIETQINEIFAHMPDLREPSTLHQLPHDRPIFIANSMPIRDANTYLFPKGPLAPIFANRGLSGIDGNIATAVGIALGSQQPTVAVLGDLAALHDLNSLALLKNSPYPVILFVINNQGGGIFSFLPIAQAFEAFETHLAAAHPFTFSKAAQLFQIPYFEPDSDEALQELLSRKESCVIEVRTDRKENHSLHQEILERVLCKLGKTFSSSSPAF